MSSLAAFALLISGPLSAQDDRAPEFVYEAYYAVQMAETEDWNRQYREYSVPILRELVDEGVIEGSNQMQHHAGGDEYNYRFVVRTCDWASIHVFWREYLERLQASTPAGEWAASSRSVTAHRDEIWDMEEMGWSDEPGYISHMYASTFRVNVQDMAEWNASWDALMRPVLDEAIAKGLLARVGEAGPQHRRSAQRQGHVLRGRLRQAGRFLPDGLRVHGRGRGCDDALRRTDPRARRRHLGSRVDGRHVIGRRYHSRTLSFCARRPIVD